MNLTMLTELLIIFVFATATVFVARKAGVAVGLVDKPNYRKKHQGLVPLVGGISIFISVCFAFLISDEFIAHKFIYLGCAGALVLVGALDDRFDLSVKLRAGVQAVVAIIMMVFANLKIDSLGHAFGPWELTLGPFSYVLTLFAVWGAVNAFNMVDGIDGLLGGLSCVSFGALGILFALSGNSGLAFWCFTFIAAILPYICFNLGLFGRRFKVFMGDAGSTLIGFTIIWLLTSASQGGEPHAINAVTALWIIAIPLMDMVAIMYRRLRKGMSPFSPDRQHIHHLIMRSGFTSRESFVVITLAAAVLAAIGIAGQVLSFVPEWVMLALFLLAFIMYGYCIKRAWKVARFIKRYRRRVRRKSVTH
ncbi:UDP-N-acetylglucosamine--undecaprenyl-phosphate N-acetylglucosaminephosphotransferase [Morganella morganii]|nr:UDP-N-acetylglucosamine--undecaprenyl-phosphate N-acetylglucosaminephosphotransferase [Morganella morganii]